MTVDTVGYQHPLSQLSVGPDPWGHQQAGIFNPDGVGFRGEDLDGNPAFVAARGPNPTHDPLEIRDAAWEDSEGRLPMDAGYTGTYWTGRTKPADANLRARADAAVAAYKARQAAAQPSPAPESAPAPSPAANGNGNGSASAVERAVRVHEALGFDADPAQIAAVQAAAREHSKRLERERFAAERTRSKTARAASDGRAREGRADVAPGQRVLLSDAAIERARVLYYDEMCGFPEAAGILLAEGLVEDSPTIPQMKDRLSGAWRRRGWTTRSAAEARAASLRRKNLTGGEPAVPQPSAGQAATRGSTADPPVKTVKRAGHSRGPRPRLSDEQVEEARRLYYAEGEVNSLRVVAERMGLVGTTYTSARAAADALYAQFKNRGWTLRTQAEATAARNFKHGLRTRDLAGSSEAGRAYRRFLAEERGWTAIQGPGRPFCVGKKPDGTACERHALEGSDYCYGHDPDRAEARATHHRCRPRKPMLPCEPFSAWLHELHAEHGTWGAVGALLGMGGSGAHRWASGRIKEVGVDTVQRCAARAGVSMTAIYTLREVADLDRDLVAA